MKIRLYVSNDGRWYRVPEGVELPAGELVLHGIFGGRREVDPAAVENLRVEREEAEQLFKLRVADWMKGGAAGLGRLHTRLSDVGPPTLERMEQAVARIEEAVSQDRIQQAANVVRDWWTRR